MFHSPAAAGALPHSPLFFTFASSLWEGHTVFGAMCSDFLDHKPDSHFVYLAPSSLFLLNPCNLLSTEMVYIMANFRPPS